jgi:hypothetical protein
MHLHWGTPVSDFALVHRERPWPLVARRSQLDADESNGMISAIC